MTRIAIVGGGPGGLMTARLLERAAGPSCQVTVVEAAGRVGGKLDTRHFQARPARYEAGVAECYDVSAHGPDPLKTLVRDLGLTPAPTASETVCVAGDLLEGDDGLARRVGHTTVAAIAAFRARMTAAMPPHQWHRGLGHEHNAHPWARLSWADILAQVDDPAARHYLQLTSHADLAGEPQQVNGLVGLRNFLKGVPGYLETYTLRGGMSELARALAAGLRHTRVVLDTVVTGIEGDDSRGYTVAAIRAGRPVRATFDAVVVAVPCAQLSRLRWGSAALASAVAAHAAHYDRQGHYLRVSLLFDERFWRDSVPGSWFMSDRFGGCCVYDESAAGAGAPGVLAFLLAGAAAHAHDRLDDGALARRALEALPAGLRQAARARVLESRVHRWIGALSAGPGGTPWREPSVAHQPEPDAHRRVTVVGDYLFDSTLNGVLRSAALSSDLVLAALSQQAPARRTSTQARPCDSDAGTLPGRQRLRHHAADDARWGDGDPRGDRRGNLGAGARSASGTVPAGRLAR